MTDKTKALVVLSGGQDSVTCLIWANEYYDEVHTITFNYGQRHRVELELAEHASKAFAASHKLLDVRALSEVATSALTNATDDISANHALHGQLPASYVPNRNATFLTLAHSYAQTLSIETIITGVCQTDYSGYPDCRQHFISYIAGALNSGAETNIEIVTPLMNLTKAETWAMAANCAYDDAVDFVVRNTLTCYEGHVETFNEWGHGCGKCPACKLRKAGYEEWKANAV